MRNVVTLTLNDLAVSFQNKTIYLMVFIPLFVFFSLTVLDRPDEQVARSKIGVIRGEIYAEGIVPSLVASVKIFTVTWLASEADAKTQLLEKSLDGVLVAKVAAPNMPRSSELWVLKKESVRTVAILEGLAQLQRAAEGRSTIDWISSVAAIKGTQRFQDETLPIWILMMILLVGFMVVPPQVAEEKEKKTLLGLLQTPMREWEWLLAKVLMGMTLGITSIALLHFVSRFGLGDGSSYLLFLVAGSFCFSSMGVLLGFLCRTQASARVLGVVFYLPFLLPSALADYSKKLNAVAAFVPSYQLFLPVRTILLDGGLARDFVWQFCSLIGVGLMCCGAAVILLKRRWLM